MKLRSLFLALILSSGCLFYVSCGNSEEKTTDDQTSSTTEVTEPVKETKEFHGTEIKAGDVQLTTPLNQQWVTAGKAIYDLKCQSCHKLTDERVVGPGWKDVTKRREPHWIMNMITNVEMMLETDPEAQKLLEQCLVRMPNQNISKDDSRQLLEYMRSNDGVK